MSLLRCLPGAGAWLVGLLATVPLKAQGPIDSLQMAGCDDSVIAAYKADGRSGAIRNAQNSHNLGCLQAALRLSRIPNGPDAGGGRSAPAREVQTPSNARQGKDGAERFNAAVRQRFREAGYAFDTCVSAQTRGAAATNPAWLWIAFADCRLWERRWDDAVENLVIAAAKTDTTDQHMRGLILDRLQAVAAAATHAGHLMQRTDIDTSIKRFADDPAAQWLIPALRSSRNK
jgi:hypothetical protein